MTGLAGRALQQIEATASDSKLNAFGALLNRIGEGKPSSRRILVVADFVATLFYLAADIEGRAMTYQLLHGAMAAEERSRSLELFSNGDGILVASRAVIGEGIDLSNVTDLVLYDAPRAYVAAKQFFAWFDRFGRHTQLNFHVLTATNTADEPMSESSRRLTNIFGFRAGEGTRE